MLAKTACSLRVLMSVTKSATLLFKTCILVYLITASPSSLSDLITLRADPWCPYNCQPGENPGFMVEIAQQVFAKSGHHVDYALLNWARAKNKLAAGDITGVVGMALSENSKDKWIFPDTELGVEQFCFFARHTRDWHFENLASLKSVTTGIINDYGYGAELDQYFKLNESSDKVLNLAGNDALDRHIGLLLINRIDVVIEDKSVFLYTLKKKGLMNKIGVRGCYPNKRNVYIVFSKVDEKANEYARILGDGIRILRASGHLDTILQKYGVTDWR